MSEVKTIAYWVAKAREAINEAETIADRTGQEFTFSLGYGMGGTYYPPQPEPPMTKSEALALLQSGVTINEEQKQKIIDAIERGSIASDDEWESSGWESSNEGWISSSQHC